MESIAVWYKSVQFNLLSILADRRLNSNSIASCQTLSDGFAQNPHDPIDLVGAASAVFCERSKITVFGNTPPAASIADLVTWIDEQIGENAVYSTNSLVSEYPRFAPYKDVACGLLALRISRLQQTYLLWFRPVAAEFRISRPLPTVQGDQTQLTELFTNLISNAIEYNALIQKCW